MNQLTQHEIAELAQEEKNRPLVNAFQKLSTPKGFYDYWFDHLPEYRTQTECFTAVNDLHEELFGHPKYTSFDSFDRSKRRFTQK